MCTLLLVRYNKEVLSASEICIYAIHSYICSLCDIFSIMQWDPGQTYYISLKQSSFPLRSHCFTEVGICDDFCIFSSTERFFLAVSWIRIVSLFCLKETNYKHPFWMHLATGNPLNIYDSSNNGQIFYFVYLHEYR